MNCEYCNDKPELVTIDELTGELPKTHDFDKDGKLFKVCPNCFSCDNIGFREERLIKLRELLSKNQISYRDKCLVLKICCDKNNIKLEQKRITVSKVMSTLKNKSDNQIVRIISEYFNLESVKVSMLFQNVKFLRLLKGARQ